MLAFVDESYQPVNGTTDVFFTTHAAACLPRDASRDFSRELFNLKRHFWKINDPAEKEIKGNLLLRKRSLEEPKNREFVENILALLREMDFKLFAVIQKGPLGTFKSRAYLQRPFQFFLERINRYTKTKNPDSLATRVYDSIEDKANRIIAESVSNFLFRHGLGKEFEHILDFATFGESTTTPGLQIADIVAYCVNCRFAGRRGRLEGIYQQMSQLTEDWKDDRGVTNWGFRFLDQTSPGAKKRELAMPTAPATSLVK